MTVRNEISETVTNTKNNETVSFYRFVEFMSLAWCLFFFEGAKWRRGLLTSCCGSSFERLIFQTGFVLREQERALCGALTVCMLALVWDRSPSFWHLLHSTPPICSPVWSHQSFPLLAWTTSSSCLRVDSGEGPHADKEPLDCLYTSHLWSISFH